ncbi:MAG TPA: hypothetical protein VLU25_20605 [Acidobacteriota bacterium]|nr:hypothetical protein [Acidobacteriota bacterium]
MVKESPAKKSNFTTTFQRQFINEMKIYSLHKGFQVNELIEVAVRSYMNRNPVKKSQY